MNIGLHIRLHNHMTAVAQKALRLHVPFFQTFVLNAAGHFFHATATDKKQFLALRHNFGPLFLHASYWINCASTSSNADRLLDRELALAHELSFDYFILHPGALTKQHQPATHLETIADRLIHASKVWPSITILIENVAHHNRTIGGDLHELGQLARLVDHRHNIGFCIDTAHAYAYGYDISTPTHIDQFLHRVDREIGLDRVPLIHLNDTTKPCSSHIDAHTVPAKGNIGYNALAHLYRHSTCKHKKFIVELPPFAEDKEKAILAQIREW